MYLKTCMMNNEFENAGKKSEQRTLQSYLQKWKKCTSPKYDILYFGGWKAFTCMEYVEIPHIKHFSTFDECEVIK